MTGLELTIVSAMLAGTIILIGVPASRICQRLGFSPWLGLLAVIPIVNVLLLWFVAFARSPGGESRT